MTFLGYKWNEQEFPLFRNFTSLFGDSKALQEVVEYIRKIDKDRHKSGRSFEGRPLYLAILTD
jgi:hypothetical protein